MLGLYSSGTVAPQPRRRLLPATMSAHETMPRRVTLCSDFMNLADGYNIRFIRPVNITSLLAKLQKTIIIIF